VEKVLIDGENKVLASIFEEFKGDTNSKKAQYLYDKVIKTISKIAKFIKGGPVKMIVLPNYDWLIVDTGFPEVVKKILEVPLIKISNKVVIIFRKLWTQYQSIYVISINKLDNEAVYNMFERVLEDNFKIKVSKTKIKDETNKLTKTDCHQANSQNSKGDKRDYRQCHVDCQTRQYQR